MSRFDLQRCVIRIRPRPCCAPRQLRHRTRINEWWWIQVEPSASKTKGYQSCIANQGYLERVIWFRCKPQPKPQKDHCHNCKTCEDRMSFSPRLLIISEYLISTQEVNHHRESWRYNEEFRASCSWKYHPTLGQYNRHISTASWNRGSTSSCDKFSGSRYQWSVSRST